MKTKSLRKKVTKARTKPVKQITITTIKDHKYKASIEIQVPGTNLTRTFSTDTKEKAKQWAQEQSAYLNNELSKRGAKNGGFFAKLPYSWDCQYSYQPILL